MLLHCRARHASRPGPVPPPAIVPAAPAVLHLVPSEVGGGNSIFAVEDEVQLKYVHPLIGGIPFFAALKFGGCSLDKVKSGNSAGMVFEFLAAQKQAKAAKAPTAHLIPGAKPVSQEEFKVWLAQHTPIALMSRLFLCVPR